jgi:hypothetical protein
MCTSYSGANMISFHESGTVTISSGNSDLGLSIRVTGGFEFLRTAAKKRPSFASWKSGADCFAVFTVNSQFALRSGAYVRGASEATDALRIPLRPAELQRYEHASCSISVGSLHTRI